uniref:valine--tRNA ligase n=1 Tax=Aplanochytrium stocchinoi TaxID=215587 RepID=A0A7S3PLC7_9STRA
MAARAIESVDKGDLKIVPEFHKATWRRWLTDPHQWCISRQLWWGHRIPAYLVKVQGIETAEEVWVVGHTEEEALENAVKKVNVDKNKITLVQDEDVLDTWFSSGLFPMSVFGWPKSSNELDAFFPGTLLETGNDILFFWVARMVMMSQTLTGKLPFETVYLHAIVRDRYGRKMSKSLGNIIDPISVIEGVTLDQLHDILRNGNLPEKEVEKAIAGQKLDYPEGIPQCGADALRFGLLANITQGQDINLDINNVAAYRRFCNKLWQVTRFCLGVCGNDLQPIPDFVEKVRINPDALPLALRDRWILSELASLVKTCEIGFKSYIFADITFALIQFWTSKLCDIYVESIKPVIYKKNPTKDDELAIKMAKNTLLVCLDYGLRLMHPLMPFVTEELWQRLPGRTSSSPESIMIAPYPTPEDVNGLESEHALNALNLASDISQKMRSLRADYNITGKTVQFYLTVDAKRKGTVEDTKIDIEVLGSGIVNVLDEGSEPPKGCSMAIVDGFLHVHIFLKGAVDAQAQVKKLQKEYDAAEKSLQSTNKKLSNTKFTDSAPAQVLEDTQIKAADLEAKLGKLRDQIEEFKQLMD